MLTLKEFKEKNGGGYTCVPENRKRFERLTGNCNDMIVVDYLYNPLNGVYTVYLRESRIPPQRS